MAKGKSKKAKGSKKKQTNYGPRINAVAVSSDGKFLVSNLEGRWLISCNFRSNTLYLVHYTVGSDEKFQI